MARHLINIRGELLDLSLPRVMGIVNVTPDSFALHCSSLSEADILRDVDRAVENGASIVDLGACSTRPGSKIVDSQEEWRRLEAGLKAIRKRYPRIVLSVDTFRAEIAERAVNEYGADIINDISGMEDIGMVGALSRLRVPYILTYARKKRLEPDTKEVDVVSDMVDFLERRLDMLKKKGVKDVILDPGFGFSKDLRQNYIILRHLDVLRMLNAPVLVGLSRKSMLFNVLDTTPDETLNATTAANMLALMNGADILRVHDVKEAGETIRIYLQTYPDKI